MKKDSVFSVNWPEFARLSQKAGSENSEKGLESERPRTPERSSDMRPSDKLVTETKKEKGY